MPQPKDPGLSKQFLPTNRTTETASTGTGAGTSASKPLTKTATESDTEIEPLETQPEAPAIW